MFSPTPIMYAGKNAINKIQIMQNKTLRSIFYIRWDDYIHNQDIHTEHNIEHISSKIHRRFIKQHDKLQENNPIIGGETAYFRVANKEDACEMCYGGISSWWMAVESVASSTGMDDGLAPDWCDAAFW